MSLFTQRLKPRHALGKLAIAQIEQLALRPQDIITAMGYQPKNAIQACDRLRHVLSSPTLGLDNSYYDFRFSSLEFLKTLFTVLSLAPADYQADLEQLQYELANPIIPPKVTLRAKIDFDFSRSADNWLTKLGVAGFYHVSLPTCFHKLNVSAQDRVIQSRIQAHYHQHHGNLPYRGVITGYELIVERSEEREVSEFELPNTQSSP